MCVCACVCVCVCVCVRVCVYALGRARAAAQQAIAAAANKLQHCSALPHTLWDHWHDRPRRAQQPASYQHGSHRQELEGGHQVSQEGASNGCSAGL